MNVSLSESSDLGNKKWYVFYSERHHGPYSSKEIEEKIRKKILSEDHLIWSENLNDWCCIKEIETFALALLIPGEPGRPEEAHREESLLQEALRQEAVLEGSLLEKRIFQNDKTHPSVVLQDSKTENLLQQKQVIEKLNLDSLTLARQSLSFNQLPSLNQLILLKLKSIANYLIKKTLLVYYLNKKTTITFALVLVITASVFTYFQLASPPMDGATFDQLRELSSVRALSLTSNRATATVALINNDPLNPFFYIAANIPDERKLSLTIEGIPETMLDIFYFKMVSSSKIKNRFVMTPALRQKNGNAIPRGEYKITVSCEDCGTPASVTYPQNKIFFEKTMFMGGLKDHSYDEKLKTYHLFLRKQAQSEIIEIKQISDNLEKQLMETTSEFEKILELSKSAEKTNSTPWVEFHSRWTAFQNQLDILYNSWTPEILTEKIYFGSLYSSLQEVAQKIRKIHTDQNKYISASELDEDLEGQIANNISLVQSEIQQIRVKATLAERLPTNSNGMPQRFSISTQ